MANGLFNIYDARANEQENLEKSAMNFANLSPGRGMVAASTQAGGMFGQGARDLLGGMSPEQAKQRKVQQISQKYMNRDKNDPELYKEMAQEFTASGLYDMADEALDLYKKTKNLSDLTSIEKKIEGAKKYVPECKDDPNSELCIRLAEEKALTFQRARPGEKAEAAYGKEVLGASAKRDTALVASVETAIAGLEKTQEVLDLLDQGQVNTGVLGSFKQNFDRILSATGISRESALKASNTQVVEALLGSDVFGMISTLGIGAKGLDTPAERDFLIKVMTGQIGDEPETIRRLTELRQKYSRKILEKYNQRLKEGRLNKYMDYTGDVLEPIDIDSIGKQYASPNYTSDKDADFQSRLDAYK